MRLKNRIPIKRIKSALVGCVFTLCVIFLFGSSPSEVVVTSSACTASVVSAVHGFIQQDDPALIHYIRNNVLWPPDEQPYNLDNPDVTNYSSDSLEDVLDALFDRKKSGTFFEAGAFTGEEISNTLYLEKTLSWSGLLVEASPENYNILKTKHRKSWVAPSCISVTPYPQKVTLMEAGPQTWIEGFQKDRRAAVFLCPFGRLTVYEDEELHKDPDFTPMPNCSRIAIKKTIMQCFPLFSLLLASGVTSIDFMSLDVEGSEIDILRTLPFDEVDIKVLFVEVSSLKGNSSIVAEFLKTKGYSRRRLVGKYDISEIYHLDELFIKDGLSIPI